MDDTPDPALQFFPSGEVDLYGVLGVPAEATEEEIKKAYRKLALRFHPDKVLSNQASASAGSSSDAGPKTKEEAQLRFQQLGFAYAVLSTPARRTRYDKTGRTNEGLFAGMGEDGDMDWDEYFKELWTGTVSGKSLEEFKSKYQNSEEERGDLFEAYEEAQGSLEMIFTLVPCCEVLADEKRFVEIIDAAIEAGELEKLDGWTASKKDEKGRKAMRSKAKKEAEEAEAYARELGVWDDLFGEGRKTGTKSKTQRGKKADDEPELDGEGHEDDHDEEEDDDEPAPRKGKGKAKSKAPAAASSSKAKGKSKKGEDDAGMDGLAALIRNRSASRQNGLDNLIARLEAQEAAKGGSKKGKGKKAEAAEPSSGKYSEPTDEEFEALQKKMFGGDGKAKEKAGKGKREAAAEASSSKKTKKAKK